MEREWTDQMGREWLVEAEPADRASRLGGADAWLSFSSDGAAPRSIEVLGPVIETLPEIDDRALEHALDAAGAVTGVLLATHDGELWWARGPESDPFGGDWAVKFSDGSTEMTHEGPLPDDLEALGEDYLRELLDEVRGRLIDPMDVSEEEEEG